MATEHPNIKVELAPFHWSNDKGYMEYMQKGVVISMETECQNIKAELAPAHWSNDKEYLEYMQIEYRNITVQGISSQEVDERQRLSLLVNTMGFHSRLKLDYNRWLGDCIEQENWSGLCRLIEQQVKYELLPCSYGGYNHEAYLWSVLDAFACGDTQTIELALPWGVDIKNCNKPVYLVAANLLMALWHNDNKLMEKAIADGTKFIEKKTPTVWERAMVAFLMDLHTGDMEKASRDLQTVCSGYSGLKFSAQPKRELCINAHGLYCMAQLILPKEAFEAIQMPKYKNFSKGFALWRLEHQHPSLDPYFRYTNEMVWLNRIYNAPPTKLILRQLDATSTSVSPRYRQDWSLHGLKMQSTLVESLWSER